MAKSQPWRNRRRKTFSCPGVLYGGGSREQCVVMGTHELAAGQEPQLIRLSIMYEPERMMDGQYNRAF